MSILLLSNSNPYIPWDTDMFMRGIAKLTGDFGTIFNVCFWIFLGIVSIAVLKQLGTYFFG